MHFKIFSHSIFNWRIWLVLPIVITLECVMTKKVMSHIEQKSFRAKVIKNKCAGIILQEQWKLWESSEFDSKY